MFDFSNYSPESNYYNDLKKLVISKVKKMKEVLPLFKNSGIKAQ